MKDKIYKIAFDLFVCGEWVEDGITVQTLKQRIKEELPTNLCRVALGNEIVVKNLEVSVKK